MSVKCFCSQETESQLSDDGRPVATVAPHAASSGPAADVSCITSYLILIIVLMGHKAWVLAVDLTIVGGYSVYFWEGVCRWESETLTIYQTMFG